MICMNSFVVDGVIVSSESNQVPKAFLITNVIQVAVAGLGVSHITW